jgi:methyl-accepting chemotaxis protein
MTWFRDLRITYKLTGTFFVMVALSAFMGLSSYSALGALDSNTEQLAGTWLPATRQVALMRFALTQYRMQEIKHIVAALPADKQRYEESKTRYLADAERAIEGYAHIVFSDEQRQELSRLKEAWARYQALDATMIGLSRTGKRDQATAMFEGEAFRAYGEVLDTVNRIVDWNVAGGEREAAHAAVTYQRSRSIILMVVGLSVLLGLALVIVVPRAIGRPVRAMAEVACKLASGCTDQQIDHQSKDEIGELAESFRALVKYLKTVAKACERLGAGDLSVEVAPQSDQDLLARSFGAAVSSLRQTIRRITDTSVSLQSAAEELGNVSAQMGTNAEETSNQAGVVAAAADQVSKNVQTVASSAEEMSSSVKEVAKNAAEAARVATTAVQVAERTNVIVTKLGGSSLEIGNVIKVITSIAEQTNLLALNATIEAARAGEAGKGFAVVANEVKELAKETAKATEDIGRKIQTIQGDTKEAVEAIAEISSTIAQVSDIQNTIAGAVEEQAATTNEIGRNVAEAARASSDIAQNIGGVAQAAHSTSTGATQSQGAAAELARMATELQAMVAQFDVGEMMTGMPSNPYLEAANENARPRRGKFAA